MFVILGVWIGLVLLGWSVVFSASDEAVRSSSTGATVELTDRLYFAGYSVFTLGNGDFRPGKGLWQLATVAASGSGLVLTTLAITYLVPVASAVAQRRELASYIAAMGDSPVAIVADHWTGRDFGGITHNLLALTHLLHTARQRHLTYPVLHYFHSDNRESAAAPSLCRLADALDLLRHGVVHECRPDLAILDTLDRSISMFLETLATAYVKPWDDPLPSIDLADLRARGVPVVSDEEYRDGVSASEERRRLLAGYLADDGWRVPVSGSRPG